MTVKDMREAENKIPAPRKYLGSSMPNARAVTAYPSEKDGSTWIRIDGYDPNHHVHLTPEDIYVIYGMVKAYELTQQGGQTYSEIYGYQNFGSMTGRMKSNEPNLCQPPSKQYESIDEELSSPIGDLP